MSTTLRSNPGEDAVSLYDDPERTASTRSGAEAEPAVGPPKTPPPPDPTAWQTELVGLLAAIEHVRWGLRGRKAVAGGLALLGFAENTLHACESLARETSFPHSTTDVQAEAVAKAGTFVSRLSQIRPVTPPHGGLFRSVLSAFAPEAAPLDPLAVQDCLVAHHEALNGYFTLFTEHFQSSKAARGWVEAASCFLADYKAMIRDLV